MVPSTYYPHMYGVHRRCYSTFTNVSRILKRTKPPTIDEAGPSGVKKRRQSQTASVLFPADQCLFCEQGRKTKHKTEEALVKCVTTTAHSAIQAAAMRKRDHVLEKVVGVDLIAKEVYYHASCRKDYTRESTRNFQRRKLNESIETKDEQAAHIDTFDHICSYIDDSIIQGVHVERMTILKEKYLAFMQNTYPQFYNPLYKTYKLKDKIMKRFGDRIRFWQPNYKSELVYSSDVPDGQAIELAFELAASDSKRVEEAALIMRRNILQLQKDSTEMPWPPSATFLLNEREPSALVLDFLGHLLAAKSFSDASSNKRRLANSIAQDICYTTTRGQWKMPKHFLLGMWIRHLTGSAELVTLINRFGHCVSYCSLLELETAKCNSIAIAQSVVPSTIQRTGNIVTYLCWDNFDLLEETPSGMGTTHTAHGIVIQEVIPIPPQQTQSNDVPHIAKSKARSVTYTSDVLEPCFAKEKVEPSMQVTVVKVPLEKYDVELAAQRSDMVWILCRAHLQRLPQTVPNWAGWISMTGRSVVNADTEQKSVIDYMAPVNFPITENATVQRVLNITQAATKEVGQHSSIVTFDLAVARKAYAIIWQNPEKYSDVFVRMGIFHTTCSYLGALGKYLRGSGFEEIVIESGICASGSINKVMTGKHYNRALRVHKTLLESLERKLIKAFEASEGDMFGTDERTILDALSNEPSNARLQEFMTNDKCMKALSLYSEFRDKVSSGKLGKTAQYCWLGYMNSVHTVLQFLRATKENNLDLHIACLQKMCPMFFSFDHHNYARYTTVYLLTLLNIDQLYPGLEDLLRNNGFSVNRSSVPSSRNAVDITIEQTINRHAKSHGGIIGFSRNYAAYYRWCMTRHFRASYLNATLELADMNVNEESLHKDTRKAEISRSESDVTKVVNAIGNFIDPFEVSDESLYCLSSGAPPPKDVVDGLLSAETIGKQTFARFVQERFVDKSVAFHAPIKQLHLKTFAPLAKVVKLSSSQRKTKELVAERNIFGQLISLALKHNIDMEKVLSYPLGPVPWSLATADGSPAKTDKAKLMHQLEGTSHIVDAPPKEHVSYIIDGNAMLHMQTALPNTFADLAESIYNQLPKVERVDFVTDTYQELSIKALERLRRGTSKTYIIKGPLTKVPRDWKLFLSNASNKTQLVSLLISEWKQDKYAPKMLGKTLRFVSGEQCMQLTTTDGKTTQVVEIEELHSSQEEADTRIILHCAYQALNTPEDNTIVVRSPDTDVFVLLLKYGQTLKQQLLLDTGTGNKRRLIDIHGVIGEIGTELCLALPALHAFTGCDSTSAFVRRGKVTPWKTLQRHPEFVEAFHKLGTSQTVDETLFQTLEHFVCLLYNKSDIADINKLRMELFLQKCSPRSGDLLSTYNGADLSLLPPCRSSLKMHVTRANYQTLIWNNADRRDANIPPPYEHGWEVNNGSLECKWTEGDHLPSEMVDLLVEERVDVSDSDEAEEPEAECLLDTMYDVDDAYE